MPIDTNGHLWIFCLNVGQADTTVMVTPQGKLLIIDAVKPDKLEALLSDLGYISGDHIENLIVTHPHYDHYSGVQRLINTYTIDHVILGSLWQYDEDKPGYNNIINAIDDRRIPVTFLAGYMQHYPDDTPFRDPDTPCLELLGPSNRLIQDLHQAKKLNTNHRSIMSRLQWHGFVMVIAADAQMENWANFDAEQMLNLECDVLRSAHHGSPRGTQFERIERLAPEYVVVSSNPEHDDHLPDLVGCAAFSKYASSSKKPVVALTHETKSIWFDVSENGSYDVWGFTDDMYDTIELTTKYPLDANTNPTDWQELIEEQR